jgi:hypothetical protein
VQRLLVRGRFCELPAQQLCQRHHLVLRPLALGQPWRRWCDQQLVESRQQRLHLCLQAFCAACEHALLQHAQHNGRRGYAGLRLPRQLLLEQRHRLAHDGCVVRHGGWRPLMM